MKIDKPRYHCPLDRFLPAADPDAIKREGWRAQKILVIAANDERLDFVEREFVRRLGERLYGGKDHG